MAVTRGIDADADTVKGTRGRRGRLSHGRSPQERTSAGRPPRMRQAFATEPVSFLRRIFGEVILVMSGQAA
jgi:hypothetical protein